MEIQNHTAFAFLALPGYDREGAEVFTAIVKGTFTLAPRKPIAPAAEQVPLALSDRHVGEPGRSPIRYENDLAVFKPLCDLVLVGSAWTPDGKPSKRIPVAFSVGSTSKVREITSEEAAKSIPLATLDEPSRKRAPDGFGFFPRHLPPRLGYAGTYDEKWKEERAPFLPDDFDYRYHQASYPDLTAPAHLRGDELLRIRNASPDGWIEAALPGIRLEVTARFEKREDTGPMALDTVVCEPDERRLLLVWRRMIACQGEQQTIGAFEVRAREGSAGN